MVVVEEAPDLALKANLDPPPGRRPQLSPCTLWSHFLVSDMCMIKSASQTSPGLEERWRTQCGGPTQAGKAVHKGGRPRKAQPGPNVKEHNHALLLCGAVSFSLCPAPEPKALCPGTPLILPISTMAPNDFAQPCHDHIIPSFCNQVPVDVWIKSNALNSSSNSCIIPSLASPSLL